MKTTIIAYSISDNLFGRISREDMQRSVSRAMAEWNRVLEGLMRFVPWIKGSQDPLILVTFGNQFKAAHAKPGSTTWATCTQFPGKLAPRWVIELKDLQTLDWKPYPATKFGRLVRRLFGTTAGGLSIVAVLLHELGHVLQLPHEEVEDLIMSETCAQREGIRPMEAARYRTWFDNYVVMQQND